MNFPGLSPKDFIITPPRAGDKYSTVQCKHCFTMWSCGAAIPQIPQAIKLFTDHIAKHRKDGLIK